MQIKSKDTERLELFSTVFLRLLKSTDILDVRALTKGPGACGDYTILLASDIDKEFRKIRLEGTDSGKTAIKDFLFARSKGITTESPSDQVACRSLAVFYIRALQLVAALTMSIYTPPDLVNRIRNRVFQTELKRQRKDLPLTLVEKEEQRIKREKWWSTFLSSTSRPEIMRLGGSGQLKYNKTSKLLTYTDPENQYEYRTLVGIRELEDYNVGPEYSREGSYWVELFNPTTREPIFRSLVNADKSGYLFSIKPEGTKEEEPIIFNKDWTSELPEQIMTSITGVAPPPPSATGLNGQTRRNIGYGMTYRHGGGGPYNNNNTLRATRKNAVKSAANIATEAQRAEEAALQLAPTTTLPRAFQESYKSMVRWTLDISTWTEAAPASYRAVLLFIKPTLPAGAAASYLCVDNWTDKSLRYIQPFAALEALYFNKDDGTMTPENKDGLKTLVDAFISVYQGAAPAKNAAKNTQKAPATFDDVFMPPINEAVRNLLCSKKTAQGDVMLDPESAQILESAQLAILAAYKSHFENAFELLTRLFTIGKTETGEQTVRFADAFAKNPGSARVVLEDIIREARSVIASHYIEVETIYSDTVKELSKPRA